MLAALTVVLCVTLFVWMVDRGSRRETAYKEREAIRQAERLYQQYCLDELDRKLRLTKEQRLLAEAEDRREQRRLLPPENYPYLPN